MVSIARIALSFPVLLTGARAVITRVITLLSSDKPVPLQPVPNHG